MLMTSSTMATDREELVNELKAAYKKLDGFLLVYHSEAPGKTLEVTVAMDDFSGLGFVHMIATRNGQKMEARMWNAEEDVTFIDQGRGVVRMQGVMAELKSINDLERALNPEEEPVVIRLIPAFHLEGTSILPNMNAGPSRKPAWENLVTEAPVEEVTEKTVVFSTEDFGLVSVSRENGLMIRQEIRMPDGEKRVLEVKSLRINPGGDAVRELSAQWTTVGAPSLNPMTLTAPDRLRTFQRMIDKVENGGGDLLKLETVLTGQRDALRNFANGCINERPGSVASRPTWKGFLDRAREALIKSAKTTQGKDLSVHDLELLLKDPEVRAKVRESIVVGMSGDGAEVPNEEVRDVVMKEIFGTSEKSHLTSTNDQGKAAAAFIRDALYRAFVEALVDRKMAQYWDKDGALD